jgi:hypothetical protein
MLSLGGRAPAWRQIVEIPSSAGTKMRIEYFVHLAGAILEIRAEDAASSFLGGRLEIESVLAGFFPNASGAGGGGGEGEGGAPASPSPVP